MRCCPKCQSTRGYSVKVRTYGFTVHEGDWSGMNERITDDSNIIRVAGKTVGCLDCGARTLMKLLRAA